MKCCTIFIRLLKRRIFIVICISTHFFRTNRGLFVGNNRFSIVCDLNNEL